MAIFRGGAIVGAISGNVGGVSFVAGSKGTIVRQRRRRTNPSSQALQHSQTQFVVNTRLWSQFPASSRTAWDTAAADFTVTNRLGQRTHLSGFQLWLKFQPWAIPFGPFPSFIPPRMTQSPPFGITSATMNEGGPYELITHELVPGDYKTGRMFASRPLTTRPRRFFRYKDLQKITNSFTLVRDFTVNFDAIFGAPRAGETISILVRPEKSSIIPGQTVAITTTVLP